MRWFQEQQGSAALAGQCRAAEVALQPFGGSWLRRTRSRPQLLGMCFSGPKARGRHWWGFPILPPTHLDGPRSGTDWCISGRGRVGCWRCGWLILTQVGTRQVKRKQIMSLDRQIFQRCFGLVSYCLQSWTESQREIFWKLSVNSVSN